MIVHNPLSGQVAPRQSRRNKKTVILTCASSLTPSPRSALYLRRPKCHQQIPTIVPRILDQMQDRGSCAPAPSFCTASLPRVDNLMFRVEGVPGRRSAL